MNYEEDEEIRTADPVIRERLISSSSFSTQMPPMGQFLPYYQTQEEEEVVLRRIMEQSAIEYEMREFALEESRKKAREDRTKHFYSIKLKFQQFAKIDTTNREFYNTLVSHIESYESGDRISVEVDDEFYTKFRRTLENIRIGAEDKRRILAFICAKNISSLDNIP